MNQKLIPPGLRGVVFLDDVVDVGDGAGDEEGEDEGYDVVVGAPQVDVDGVEDAEEGEAPGDAVDDDSFALREELVDDRSKEEDVDEGPNQERPRSGSEIGLLSSVIDITGGSNGVDVGAQKQEVCDNIHNLPHTASSVSTKANNDNDEH